MRTFIWIIRFILFFLLFCFAIKNVHVVDLNFFFNKQWHLPLVFIILVVFAVGALLGVTATVTSLLRQRREISRLTKQLDRARLDAEHAENEALRLPEPF
ncbi:MAG: LapA family protein [Azoarcus sp.]|jgi:uncharacterized integral membrane protein|nr:LapA family protein [Azoarcus sp.]